MGEKEGEEERRRTRDCKEKNLPVRIQYITINKNRYNQKRVKMIKEKFSHQPITFNVWFHQDSLFFSSQNADSHMPYIVVEIVAALRNSQNWTNMISGMLFVLCLTLYPFKAFPGLRCCHVLGLLIEQNDWVCISCLFSYPWKTRRTTLIVFIDILRCHDWSLRVQGRLSNVVFMEERL